MSTDDEHSHDDDEFVLVNLADFARRTKELMTEFRDEADHLYVMRPDLCALTDQEGVVEKLHKVAACIIGLITLTLHNGGDKEQLAAQSLTVSCIGTAFREGALAMERSWQQGVKQ